MKRTTQCLVRGVCFFLAIATIHNQCAMDRMSRMFKKESKAEPAKLDSRTLKITNKLPIDVAFYIKGSKSKDPDYKIISDTRIEKATTRLASLQLKEDYESTSKYDVIPRPTSSKHTTLVEEDINLTTEVAQSKRGTTTPERPYENIPVVQRERPYENVPVVAQKRKTIQENISPEQNNNYRALPVTTSWSFKEKLIPIDEFPIRITIYSDHDKNDILAKFEVERNQVPSEIVLQNLIEHGNQPKTLELLLRFIHGSHVQEEVKYVQYAHGTTVEIK